MTAVGWVLIIAAVFVVYSALIYRAGYHTGYSVARLQIHQRWLKYGHDDDERAD